MKIALPTLLGWLTLSLYASCSPPAPPDPPEPAGYDPAATCESVCAHWAELGCEEAAPTPGGTKCPELCETSAAGWRLPCLAVVSTCDEIDACPRE